MDTILHRYPVDLTGRSPDNQIVGEEHLLVDHDGINPRVFALHHGGFYTRGLIVYDDQYEELRPNVDYVATYVYEDASYRTGLEVCGVIVVTNPAVNNTVYVTAQIVGGDYAYNLDATETTVQYIADNPFDPIQWADMVGDPTNFPPGGISGEVWELDGFERLNTALFALRRAVVVGDQPYMDDLREYTEAERAAAKAANDAQAAALNDHITDSDDPHEVTKAQIQLGLVADGPPATRAEALAGMPADRYLTPYTFDAPLTTAEQQRDDHIDDVDNPHEVRAVQLSAYDKAQFDDLLAQRLPIQGQAVNTALLDGKSYFQTYNEARANLPAENFTVGTFNPARLGLNIPDGTKLLRGDGQWFPASSIFAQYRQDPSKVLYIGYVGGDVGYNGQDGREGAPLNYIRQTFNNIRQYPIGTIVLYRLKFYSRSLNEPDMSTKTTTFMYAAVRTSSGWTNRGNVRYDYDFKKPIIDGYDGFTSDNGQGGAPGGRD